MRVQTVLSISKLSGPPVSMLMIGRFERRWEGWMAGEGKRKERALSTRDKFVTGHHNPRTLAFFSPEFAVQHHLDSVKISDGHDHARS